MLSKAFEALHVAATAIKTLNGITDVSVDNDGGSGEIIFDVADQRYVLRLEEEHTEALRFTNPSALTASVESVSAERLNITPRFMAKKKNDDHTAPERP